MSYALLMKEQLQRKYAKLILEVGINLQKGQKLFLSAESYHVDFLRIVTEEAYKIGASYVHVETENPAILKARVEYANKEELDLIPNWVEQKYATMIDEEWARVRFFGPTEPDMLGELDGKRLGIIQRSASIAAKPMSEASGTGTVTWCVVALPTPKWAAKVYNEEPSAEVEEQLWQQISDILSLEAEDPSAIWREKAAITRQRCEALKALSIDRLHFEGPGTDLSVYCFENAQWIGGGIKNKRGREYIPNLPTEECFSTPHALRTEGKVRVVRPVEVLGKSVEGAWFVFKEGKVVDYGAEENQSALDEYFTMCPQAAYLGEVALVDANSPIFQSGKVFHCILYDENASCHIALGNGYPIAVPGGMEMSRAELKEQGVNVSLLHTDFMIGGPEVEVTAYDKAGNASPVIRDGVFVIT